MRKAQGPGLEGPRDARGQAPRGPEMPGARLREAEKGQGPGSEKPREAKSQV